MHRPRHVLYLDTRSATAPSDLGLAPCCYDVRSATSVAEALRLAEARYFDLYLIARCAEDPEGAEFLARVRAFNGYTPILFHHGVACRSCRSVAKHSSLEGSLDPYSEPWELDEAIVRQLGRAQSSLRERACAFRTNEARTRTFPTAAA